MPTSYASSAHQLLLKIQTFIAAKSMPLAR